MTNSEYRELVEFLGQRFTAIDCRFDAVDQRLDGVERRFEVIERRLDGMDRRFETIDLRFESMQQYMDRRFEALQQQIDERHRDVLGHFDAIYGRLERLDQEYQAITQALRRIEALLADEQGRREILERRLEELKDNVLLLQARIEEVERRLRQ
jgi:chromosome segregation ATPase